jgi:hypothetical protein
MKVSLATLAACCSISAAKLPAQTDEPPDRSPTASMKFDSGASIALPGGHGLTGRVLAFTNQAVATQLQFPADLAGKNVFVQSLDGAQIIGQSNKLVLAADGTATVQLRLGVSEGLYRVVVSCQDSRSILRFYAVAPGKSSPDSTLLVPGL